MDRTKSAAPEKVSAVKAPGTDSAEMASAESAAAESADRRTASASQIAVITAKSTASVVLKTAVFRRIRENIAAMTVLPVVKTVLNVSVSVASVLLTIAAMIVKIAVLVVLKILMPGLSAVSILKSLMEKRRNAAPKRRSRRNRRETSPSQPSQTS